MIDFDTLLIGPCMQTFGEPVVYDALGGVLRQAIQAVFFRSSMQLLPMGGAVGQESYQLGAGGDTPVREPALGVQLSQLAAPPRQGDMVTITSQNLVYEVKEVLPDGVGHARLSLTLISGC